MSQDFSRFELTIKQAVTLGVPGTVSTEQIWAALEKACLAQHVRDLPEGLDTQLGQQFDGVGLSGGQWQRLALARIFLRDLPVWILDEPTSAVDATTEEIILKHLQAESQKRIIIMISHRVWTLREVDQIYVVENGKIAEHGTYQELVAKNHTFAELFNLQTQEDSEVPANS